MDNLNPQLPIPPDDQGPNPMDEPAQDAPPQPVLPKPWEIVHPDKPVAPVRKLWGRLMIGILAAGVAAGSVFHFVHRKAARPADSVPVRHAQQTAAAPS